LRLLDGELLVQCELLGEQSAQVVVVVHKEDASDIAHEYGSHPSPLRTGMIIVFANNGRRQ
jgi:hypothetical protein